MGRNRFVTPDIKRIDIGDGDWIDVKKRLTYGEQHHIFTGGIREVRRDGYTPDRELLGKMEVMAYLVDWSLQGSDGKVVRIDTEAKKLAAIDNLDPADFDVISTAISAHVDAMAAERAAKKMTDGEPVSSAISPSAA